VDPAACVVAPLRIGGGTRLKILDAWALGKAVVSTPAGAEGLAVRDGRNILLAEAPDAFADAVLRVLDSEELRGRLEKEGRASAVERYDWDVIGAPMTAAYAALLPMSARVA
jgi:glycosyltransferase involved in cell wall biosynthesis